MHCLMDSASLYFVFSFPVLSVGRNAEEEGDVMEAPFKTENLWWDFMYLYYSRKRSGFPYLYSKIHSSSFFPFFVKLRLDKATLLE